MPTLRFIGLVETDYPFAKDAQGQNLGRVEPGDEREFDQAPDQWWVPAEPGSDPDPADASSDPGSDEGAAGEPEPHDAEPEDPETEDPETEPGD